MNVDLGDVWSDGTPNAEDVPIAVVTRRTRADITYRFVATGAGALTLVLMALIGIFLLVRSWDALSAAGSSFFSEETWNPPHRFGIAALLIGTVIIAVIALVVAVPVAT